MSSMPTGSRIGGEKSVTENWYIESPKVAQEQALRGLSGAQEEGGGRRRDYADRYAMVRMVIVTVLLLVLLFARSLYRVDGQRQAGSQSPLRLQVGG